MSFRYARKRAASNESLGNKCLKEAIGNLAVLGVKQISNNCSVDTQCRSYTDFVLVIKQIPWMTPQSAREFQDV
jgi:hypothetical protein